MSAIKECMKQTLFFLLLLAAFGCSKAPEAKPQSGPEKLKVGIILPLTGDMAMYGRDALDTALLWKKDHPNAQVEIISEDSQLDPVKSFHAAMKLIDLDHVNVLLTIDANTGRPIKRLATQYKVVQICQAWDPGISDGKFNLIGEFEPAEDAALLVKYLVTQKIKKIGILYMQNVAFSICDREIEKKAKEEGLEVVASDPFTPGVRDFRIELLKIKEGNPDILILLSFSPEMEIIGHHLKQIGWNVPLTSVNSFDQSCEHSLWNGCVSVSGMDLTGEYAKKFFAMYKRQTVYPGFTYDYLTLVNNAYENYCRDPEYLSFPGIIQKSSPFHGIVGDAVNGRGTFRYQPFLVKMGDGMPQRIAMPQP